MSFFGICIKCDRSDFECKCKKGEEDENLF